MKLTDIVNINSIALNIKCSSKDELLNIMIELATESGNIIDPVEAKREVLERERIMSTGVGKGIALPHAKTKAITDSVGAIATLENFLEYDALDGEPVNIVFLLLGKENNVGHHLRLLSKVSRLLNDDAFKVKILNAQKPQEIIDIFNSFEDGNVY